MKQLHVPVKVTARNGWGHDDTTIRVTLEVESSDVGQVRGHYLGLNHRSYKFAAADVGRKLEQIQGASWAFTS